MDNVLLLTGDVHIGQFYQAECPSFTGQTVLPEVTSSGLSHTIDDALPGAHKVIKMISREDAITSPIYLGHNYGHIKIDLKNGEENKILAQVSIRDINGQEVLSKVYNKSELAFNENNLTRSNAELCENRSTKQKNFHLLCMWLKRFILEADLLVVFTFVIMLPFILAVFLATSARVINLLYSGLIVPMRG